MVWQLPSAATVNGLPARMTTVAGQQLFITTLLPTGATMQMVDPANDGVADTVATYEPMTQRVMVAAPAGGTARFFTSSKGRMEAHPPRLPPSSRQPTVLWG